MKGNENVINARLFFFTFAYFALGIVLCKTVTADGITPLVYLASVPFPVILLFGNKNKVKSSVTVLCMAAFFFLGILLFRIAYGDFFNFQYLDGIYEVSGKVLSKSYFEEGCSYLIEITSLNGSAVSERAELSYLSTLYEGDEITLTALLSANTGVFSDSYVNFEILSDRARYTLSDIENLKITGENYSFYSFVRERMRTLLYEVTDSDTAAVCYAMLTGDTKSISYGLLKNIRYGGVAHVFAVSGLHIGVMYGELNALMRKLKAPKVAISVVCAALSFVYVGFCGYTASALRSFITCLTIDICFYTSLREDELEVLGVSGIAVLLLDVYNLFSVGAILSFVACIGMAIYIKPFKRALERVKIRGRVADGIALAIGVNIILIPVQLDFFGYVSVWGLILNVIIVPLTTFAFTPLLITSLLACSFPAFALPLLHVPCELFYLSSFLFLYVDFTTLAISGFTFGYMQIPYYTACSFLSDKLNLKKRAKLIFFIIFTLITLFGVILSMK